MLISFSSLVNKYKINVSGVIHIGGHIGQELPSYKNSNVKNILIFEPKKGPFEKLSKVAN